VKPYGPKRSPEISLRLDKIEESEAVMGLTQVGSGQFCVARARVSHLWFGFEKFPLKISSFSIFSFLGQKNLIGLGQKVPQSMTGQPFIYCGSKVRISSSIEDILLQKTQTYTLMEKLHPWLLHNTNR